MYFTETDLADIADVAALYIDYWAKDFEYYEPYDSEDPEPHMTVVCEEGNRYTLNRSKVEEAICSIVYGNVDVRSDIRDDIKRAIEEDNYGLIDATAADVIVQVACFDEIVYG